MYWHCLRACTQLHYVLHADGMLSLCVQVLRFYDVHGLSKWLDLVILAGMMLFYRIFFMATLHMREFMSRCHFRLF